MIPNNKNIAVLHPYVNKMGGAVKMMIYLSNILNKNNNLIFYSLSYDELVFPKQEINFDLKSYSSRSNLLKFFSLLEIAFKIRKLDYIIVGNSPMHFVGVISKLLFFSKAKIIWRNHHYPWYYSENTNIFVKLKRLMEKLIVSKIDLIVSNSYYLKTIVDRTWTVDSKILHPVLDDKFLDYKKTKIDKENILFSYGRWTKGKNIKVLFETYEQLSKTTKNLVLLIGGVGEELDKLKPKYKNNKNIKFLGYLAKEQIIQNLIKTKIFLFPSQTDSFGLVKLESLSVGVPVVSFDSGYEEIIINGYNGFCVNSKIEFINKTKQMLSSDTLYMNLQNNILSSDNKFNKSNFEKQLNEIFCF